MLAAAGVITPKPPPLPRRAGSGRGRRPRRSGRAVSACGAAAGADVAATEDLRARLEEHLRRLWDHHEVPSWHRQLYERRYFGGGCGAAVLQREAEELVAGTSKVQVAARSITAREAGLLGLSDIRGRFEDADFAKLGPRRELAEALLALRVASVAAVEAISTWRRSVAPPPGRGACGPNDYVRGGGGKPLRAVASACGRGARWPPPGGGSHDYLQRLAADDTVVRRFESVLELKPEGETDPFLLLTASAANLEGKMRPPPLQTSQRRRVQAAQMLLLEDLVGFSLAASDDKESLGSLAASRQTIRLDSDVSASLSSSSRKSVDGGRKSVVAQNIHNLLSFLASQHQARGTNSRASVAVAKRPSVKGSAHTSPSGFRRRGATVTMRKEHKSADMGLGLSLIPELHDSGMSPTSTVLGWKQKPQAKPVPSFANLSRESSLDSFEGARGEEENDNPPRMPTIDLLRINATFRRYSVDGYIHQDDLIDCLKHLGFPYPNTEWVDESFETVTTYSALDAGEFMLFVSAYEDHMRASVMNDFRRYDEDGSGHLEAPEFYKLFQEMHVEPMHHVMQEILEEVDKDKSGTLDFDEFFDVIRVLQEREGFSKVEHEVFVNAFKLFDRDKSGEMNEQSLYHALCFLGYEVTPEEVAAVALEVDFDGTGTIDQHEFLVCMRKLREREIQSLKTAMTMYDVDMSGTIDVEELQTILYSVGYMPDEFVIVEILEDLGLDGSRSSELNFALLWQFMVQLRKREGLCRSDSRAIEEAFERYATGTEVSAVYMSKILRFLGFSLSFEERQELILQVDVDSSGSLGIGELRKLFRICREQSAKAIKNAFKTFATGFGHNAAVSMKNLPEALRNVGCLRENQSLPDFPELHEDCLNIQAFVRIARQLFSARESEVRSNGGYSTRELEDIRDTFRDFDADASGCIHNHELVNLVKAMFPEMAADPKLRPQLQEIIREADQDGNGGLDFDDFLRLMSTVYELRSRNQLLKEKTAVKETGFAPHEVHDFRALFQAHAQLRANQLEFAGLQDMLSSICPLGDRNLQALTVLWREALAVYQDHLDARDADLSDTIDFPEFLWLMRQVLATNFANVRERTGAPAASDRKNPKALGEEPHTYRSSGAEDGGAA